MPHKSRVSVDVPHAGVLYVPMATLRLKDRQDFTDASSMQVFAEDDQQRLPQLVDPHFNLWALLN